MPVCSKQVQSGLPVWPTSDKVIGHEYPTWLSNVEMLPPRRLTLEPIYGSEDGDDARDPAANPTQLEFPVPDHLRIEIGYWLGMEPVMEKRRVSKAYVQSDVVVIDNDTQQRYHAKFPTYHRGPALRCSQCRHANPEKTCTFISWSGPDPSSNEYPSKKEDGSEDEIYSDSCLECLINGTEDKCDCAGRVLWGDHTDRRPPARIRPSPRGFAEMMGLPARYSLQSRHITTGKPKDKRTAGTTIGCKRQTEDEEDDPPRKKQILDSASDQSPFAIASPRTSVDVDPASKHSMAQADVIASESPPQSKGPDSTTVISANNTMLDTAAIHMGGLSLQATSQPIAQDVPLPAVSPSTPAEHATLESALAVLSAESLPEPVLPAASSAHINQDVSCPTIGTADSTVRFDYAMIQQPASYYLFGDPVHKHTVRGNRVVHVPGQEMPHQLAQEAAPYLWPHNAARLGLQRWSPKGDRDEVAAGADGITGDADGAVGEVVTGGRLKARYLDSRGKAALRTVWPAFMYTTPAACCTDCRRAGRPCVFSAWIGPYRQDNSDDDAPTESALVPYLYACMSCQRGFDGPDGAMLKCSAFGTRLWGPSKGETLALTAELLQQAKKLPGSWLKPTAFATFLYPKLAAKQISTPTGARNSGGPAGSVLTCPGTHITPEFINRVDDRNKRVAQLELDMSALVQSKAQLEGEKAQLEGEIRVWKERQEKASQVATHFKVRCDQLRAQVAAATVSSSEGTPSNAAPERSNVELQQTIDAPNVTASAKENARQSDVATAADTALADKISKLEANVVRVEQDKQSLTRQVQQLRTEKDEQDAKARQAAQAFHDEAALHRATLKLVQDNLTASEEKYLAEVAAREHFEKRATFWQSQVRQAQDPNGPGYPPTPASAEAERASQSGILDLTGDDDDE